MEKRFTFVLENFSIWDDKNYYSRPFAFAGCIWHLLAYHGDDQYLSVCLKLNRESSPPGWRRDVQFSITLMNNYNSKSNIVSESVVCCFDANNARCGFNKFVPYNKLFNRNGGFLVNDSLTFILEVQHVLVNGIKPVEPVKIITPSPSYNEVAFVSNDSCKLVRKTEDVSNESLDDDDDNAYEEGMDDDEASKEGMDDDDYASEKGTDDDESEEDPNDNGDGGASYPVSGDGGYRDRSLLRLKAVKEALDAIDRVAAKFSSDDDDDASQEGTDDDDDASEDDANDDDVVVDSSSLVMNDNTRKESSLDQVNSLEKDTVKNGGDRDRSNTVAFVTETSNNALEEVQRTTVDVNGFVVLSYQVESVRRIFERHPDISMEFRAKNQHLRNACMNFLLSLIDTLCQSLEELSNEDLVEADIALTYLKDAGFKVDWLEKKLDQLKENKQKELCGLVRLKEIEEHLMMLKQKCSDMNDLAEKEKAELLVTRTAMSFDDLV